MSTVKNPEEKKLLSLKHDRRNTYGENAKASRKLIPRGKQRSSKAARSAVAQALQKQAGPSTELDLDNAEALVRVRTIASKRKRFKKWSDDSLMSVLLAKKCRLIPWAARRIKSGSPARMERLRQAVRDRQDLRINGSISRTDLSGLI